LPQLIAEFRERHRAVSFELDVGGTEDCVQKLMMGKADLALVFDPPDSLTSDTIWSSDWPIGVVMRADHPLSCETSLKVIDCAPYDIVLPTEALSLRKRLENIVRRMGERGPPMLVSNSIASIKKTLQTSNAVSFLTAIDIIAEARAGTILIKPLQDRVMMVDRLALMINHSSGGSPAVHRFGNELVSSIDAFRSTFSTIGAGTTPGAQAASCGRMD
jgi:DNA-binding transcriptional LysR family regulator